MNLNPVLQTLTTFPGWLKQRAQGMFNLNDPRWGRDEDKPSSNDVKPETSGDDRQPPRPPNRPQGQGPNQGPPDLDELWRDFNRKLSGLFGGAKNGGNRGGFGGGGNGGAGGAGGAAGAGAISSAITTAGMVVSTGGLFSPACSAHRPAACNSTTLPATSALRCRVPVAEKRSEWGMQQWRAGSAESQRARRQIHKQGQGWKRRCDRVACKCGTGKKTQGALL